MIVVRGSTLATHHYGAFAVEAHYKIVRMLFQRYQDTAAARYLRVLFFFSSRRRHTRYWRDWSSDVCSSDLFSPDKRLYKTHAGAVLTRSGGKRDPGLLYLHVAPGESMVGAGFWHPEPDILARLRRAILAEPDAFTAIAERMTAAGSPLTSDECLSRPPRGFDAAKGTAAAEFVCWKSFTAHAALSDVKMQSSALVERIAEFTRLALPL